MFPSSTAFAPLQPHAEMLRKKTLYCNMQLKSKSNNEEKKERCKEMENCVGREKAKPLHQLESKLNVVRARDKLLESQEVKLQYL